MAWSSESPLLVLLQLFLFVIDSAYDLWKETSNYLIVALSNFGYGCLAIVYILCIHALYRRSGKFAWLAFTYTTTIFLLNTVTNATIVVRYQKVFIADRNYPGGPLAYIREQTSSWPLVTSVVTGAVTAWLQDGLLLWRFFVIFNRSYLLVALPILLYIATIILVVVAIILHPHQEFILTPVGAAAWYPSIALNIISTVSICTKLWLQHRRTALSMGPHRTTYLPLIAIFIESSALYTIFALIFVLTVAVNSYVQNLALALQNSAQCIAPTLTIWWIASHTNGDRTSSSESNSVPLTRIQFTSRRSITVPSETSVEAGAHSDGLASTPTISYNDPRSA